MGAPATFHCPVTSARYNWGNTAVMNINSHIAPSTSIITPASQTAWESRALALDQLSPCQ